MFGAIYTNVSNPSNRAAAEKYLAQAALEARHSASLAENFVFFVRSVSELFEDSDSPVACVGETVEIVAGWRKEFAVARAGVGFFRESAELISMFHGQIHRTLECVVEWFKAFPELRSLCGEAMVSLAEASKEQIQESMISALSEFVLAGTAGVLSAQTASMVGLAVGTGVLSIPEKEKVTAQLFT